MRAALVTVAILTLSVATAHADPVHAEPAGAFDAFVAAYKAGLPSDPAKGLAAWAHHAAALHADCLKSSDLACALLRDIYAEAARRARADRKLAASVLDGPCKAGDPIACALGAESLDDPGGTSTETPQAIERLVAACKQGATQACVRAADVRLGAGLEHPAITAAQAQAHLERGCASGFAEACQTLAAQVGAFVPGTYAETPNLLADTRACRLGLRPACRSIVENLTPVPPFGCSRCKGDEGQLDTGEYDERCRDCSILRCRKEHCCATCKDRTTYACCGDEGGEVHAYPEVAAPLDPALRARAAATARRTTERARAIWDAGCKRGLPDWCKFVSDLDASIGALEKP